MSNALALPDSDEIPASRLMRERDQARTEAAERMRRQLDAEADSARLRQRILDIRAENDRLAERLDACLEREVAAYDRGNVIARERDAAQSAAANWETQARQAWQRNADLERERRALVDREQACWREAKAQARDAAAAEVADQVARLRSLVQLAEATAEDYRSQLAEVLQNDAVGRDCDTCDGTGEVDDIEPRHCGGPTNAYCEKTVVGDCEDCFGGRVAR